MLIPTDEEIKKAIEISQETIPHPAGYRILVKPLPVSEGLKAGEAEMAPYLASKNFVTSTKKQVNREERLVNRGIVCDIGKYAFTGEHLSFHKPWVKIGDIVLYNACSGLIFDIPTGSQNTFKILNDEDIIGNHPISIFNIEKND